MQQSLVSDSVRHRQFARSDAATRRVCATSEGSAASELLEAKRRRHVASCRAARAFVGRQIMNPNGLSSLGWARGLALSPRGPDRPVRGPVALRRPTHSKKPRPWSRSGAMRATVGPRSHRSRQGSSAVPPPHPSSSLPTPFPRNPATAGLIMSVGMTEGGLFQRQADRLEQRQTDHQRHRPDGSHCELRNQGLCRCERWTEGGLIAFGK
jgi:hypothetical protein